MVGSETEDYQRNLFDLDATSTQLNARVGESGGRDTDRDVVANMRSPRRCELSRTTRGNDPLYRRKAAGCVSPADTAGCGMAALLPVAPEDVHLHEQRGQRALQSRPPL